MVIDTALNLAGKPIPEKNISFMNCVPEGRATRLIGLIVIPLDWNKSILISSDGFVITDWVYRGQPSKLFAN